MTRRGEESLVSVWRRGGGGGCDIMEIIPVVEHTLSVQLLHYTLRRPAESRESLEPVQADTWLAAPLVALSPLSAGESVSVGV